MTTPDPRADTVRITTTDGKTFLAMFGNVTSRISLPRLDGTHSTTEYTRVQCIGNARITKKGDVSRWTGSDFRYSFAAAAARAWVEAGKPAEFETEV